MYANNHTSPLPLGLSHLLPFKCTNRLCFTPNATLTRIVMSAIPVVEVKFSLQFTSLSLKVCNLSVKGIIALLITVSVSLSFIPAFSAHFALHATVALFLLSQ